MGAWKSFFKAVRSKLNADPDSTYHPDADSDFYLMRIQMRIRLFTLMQIRIQILASK
jgi:hypothetical protein